ncbi:BMC domain-containing protein [Sporosarcina sp. FSL W7-1349]|uniref:BMC domain-containing protein n=1 Tax=Sporosarcina sp. FSL W7-1349 TaxID=2921561 RepID=UPI0030FCBC72
MENQNFALGMIETIGYPALVAAADAASKAADVKVVTYQGADAGLVTIYIVGDVASVQSAVSIGAEEAKEVGRLHHSHVIARPDDSTKKLIFQLLSKAEEKKEDKPNSSEEEQPKAVVEMKEETEQAVDYTKASLQELRKQASLQSDFPLPADKIATAKKEELVKLLSAAQVGKGGDK